MYKQGEGKDQQETLNLQQIQCKQCSGPSKPQICTFLERKRTKALTSSYLQAYSKHKALSSFLKFGVVVYFQREDQQIPFQ